MKKIKMKLLLSAVIGLSVTATGIANADILPLPGASQINPAMSSGFEQQLQGAWASTQGGHNVIVIFMNNMSSDRRNPELEFYRSGKSAES